VGEFTAYLGQGILSPKVARRRLAEAFLIPTAAGWRKAPFSSLRTARKLPSQKALSTARRNFNVIQEE
jgi:hypothetical protein